MCPVLEGYYAVLNGRLTLRPSLNAYQKGNIRKNKQLVNASGLDQHINHVPKIVSQKSSKMVEPNINHHVCISEVCNYQHCFH